VAYFLKRAKLSFLLLDAEEAAGGAWRHGWDSLTLFSPSAWSSIAGWPMPLVTEGNPDRDHVVSYLEQYEARYGFPIVRPVSVTAVERTGRGLRVRSKDRDWEARAVISATGTWSKPYVPVYPGIELYGGSKFTPPIISHQRLSKESACWSLVVATRGRKSMRSCPRSPTQRG
jgi:cation diffusion facilitator CzcD-associated flavoprotein CzcO